MSDPPDGILVATTSKGNIFLPWPSADDLLSELATLGASQGTRDAFDEADVTKPALLSNEHKAEVVRWIDHWTTVLEKGFLDLNEGIWELRKAFEQDLLDANNV